MNAAVKLLHQVEVSVRYIVMLRLLGAEDTKRGGVATGVKFDNAPLTYAMLALFKVTKSVDPFLSYWLKK